MFFALDSLVNNTALVLKFLLAVKPQPVIKTLVKAQSSIHGQDALPAALSPLLQQRLMLLLRLIGSKADNFVFVLEQIIAC